MKQIKHLLFDCDGVLVDTEFTAAHKMVKVLQNFGIIISAEHYLKEFSGTTFSSIFDHFFGNMMPDVEKERIIAIVEDQVASELTLIDGVEELLKSVNLPKSVVSNSSISTVEHALGKTSISSYFSSEIFSSEMVKQPKPAPDLYLYAINSLLLAPQDVLVIEDSLSGAKAARSAGLVVIGFTGGKHILPGHDKKLLDLGVMMVNNPMDELSVTLKLLISGKA